MAWLTAKAKVIAEARGVSVEDVATEPAALAKQIARVRQHFVAMGELKADASSWVNKTYALAITAARTKYPQHSADERLAMAEADAEYLTAVRIKDDITTTMRALDKMHFELLNDRRTGFRPAMHNND